MLVINNIESEIKHKKIKSKLPALDGGWGWLVVVGSFLGHFFVGGMDRASGIIYRELLLKFNKSAAITAGLSGLLFSTRFFFAPVCGALASRFSHRMVVVCGGLLSCVGFVFTAYAPNVSIIYLTWGVFVGLGGSMIYTPSLQIVSAYFDERRATALGLSSSGTGVGSFCLPMFALLLVNEFGYTGCMTLLGAIVLHAVVAGVLYIPLEKEWRRINGVAAKYSSTQHVSRVVASQNACCVSLVDFLKQFRCELLIDPKFICVMLCSMFGSIALKSVAVILPHHAEIVGIGYSQGVLALSLAGVFDTLSRIGSGFFFDWAPIKRWQRMWYTFIVSLFALSIASLAFVNNTFTLFFVTCLFGIFSGFVSQVTTILIGVIGREKSEPAISLMLLFRGGGSFIGPPLVGYLKDLTNDYKCSFFYLAGTSLMCAFSLCLLALFLKFKRTVFAPIEKNVVPR